MRQKWPRLIFDCPWLLCGLWIVFTLKNSRSLMKYLCDIWLFQFDSCADTFCLISASTRARIIGELDQQTMKVDLKDHAGPFICLCLNADSPRCQTVHLYTWWAMGISGVRYPGFVIEWIFYWIESSQIKNFE